MGTTLGDGSTLGGVSTLGGEMNLRMESTLGGWYGTGSAVFGTGGDIYKAVSRFKDQKRSCSLEIASRWLCCAVSGASLMAQERKLRA